MVNKIISGLAISLVIGSGSASGNTIDASPYIVNGTDTTTSEYPSYVHLYYYIEDYDTRNDSVCGGTILNKNYVLTAAHCVDINDSSVGEEGLLFMSVIPNLDSLREIDSLAKKHYVSKVYVYDNYKPEPDLLNDIAILELETPLDVSNSAFISRLPFNESIYRDASERFTAVGHGLSGRQSEVSALQKTELTYVENASCNFYVGGAPETQLCMEGEIVDGLENAVCGGDSGGPLYWEYDGITYQVGLTSYGPARGCGAADPSIGATSVFTELTDYEDWINSVINGQEEADYIADDSDRQYYRENGTLPLSPPEPKISSGGGGSVPLWAIYLLPIVTLVRLFNLKPNP